MYSRNQSESMDRKKKTCKERKRKVIKGNTPITDITVVEALRSLIPPHCCNFLCSIPNVAHDCAQRLRSRVRVLGLSEKKKKKMKGGKKNPSPLPSHQRPPSINLCQLLPRAKPCLRETDLKGPIRRAAPLWGYCATTESGRSRQCSGPTELNQS